MQVLVVGANGQLGSSVCAELVRRGHRVRGTVRTAARGADLADLGVELVLGDLTETTGLAAALDGVDVLVPTANPVVPRKGDDPPAVLAGLARLVDDAAGAGVRRLVLPSVPSGLVDAHVPAIAARRDLEQRLLSAPLEGSVLRFPAFMEVWLALVGSSIPLRGEPHATAGRQSPFLRRFRALTGSLVEDRGLMLVPGDPEAPHAFIAMADVTAALADAVEAASPDTGPVEIGGPEALCWREVADVYADLLGRRVRVVSTPGAVYAAMGAALRPVAQVPAATMALNRFMAATPTPWQPGGPGLLDPARMTTVRGFLTEKAALPARLPNVA